MITLIGKNIAKEGLSFVFYGPLEECSNCRFKSSCVDSLEIGRKYAITEARDVEQKCPIHEDGYVKVVNVEDAETTVLIDSKGVFEGSTFAFKRIECDDEDCKFRHLCFAEGIKEDDKCIFVKDLGKFKDCPKGNSFHKCIIKLNR